MIGQILIQIMILISMKVDKKDKQLIEKIFYKVF